VIKIFKNIRKKLAAENKITSYLRYAIGEIVLVMIGILLALQVNNWNIDKKNTYKAEDLSANLLNELVNVKNLIENRLEGIENQKKLTQYLINNSEIQMDTVLGMSRSGNLQIDVLNFLFSFKFHLNPRADIYNSAVNEGSLALLKSNELTSYLNTAFIMSLKRMSDHALAENEIDALLNNHVSSEYQDIFVLGKLKNYDGAWDDRTTRKILEKISIDGKLRYLLSAKLHILQFKYGDLNYRILPTIERAIAYIENSKK
jgi:hypothetical protein